MRLIDAEMLKGVLNRHGGESRKIDLGKDMSLGEIVDTVIMAYRECLFAEIEKIPTAYDVDEVVKQLEERRDNAVTNISLNSQSDDLYGEIKYTKDHYNSIIEMVKAEKKE